MTPRPLLARAIGRVLLRVFAKAFAYGVILVGASWLYGATKNDVGDNAALGLAVTGAGLAALSLLVFRDKVREEAQRLRSNG